MDTETIILRFVLTFALAIIFGYYRQRAKKPIGFGTFTYVASGSCALGIIALDIGINNPLPLLAAVVTGIGFLGAGALIRTSDRAFGFTTAASIWIFAVIGLTFGIGEYLLGSLMYEVVWIVVLVDKYLEIKGIGSYQKRVSITSKNKPEENQLFELFKTKNYKILSQEYKKDIDRNVTVFYVESADGKTDSLPSKLMRTKWVESFKIE